MNILVTGSNGFIGRNLVAWLARRPNVHVSEIDRQHTPADLAERLAAADLVYHLAGVNRPSSADEFQIGNVKLTAQLCDLLLSAGRTTPIVLASSIQAELDNPYGLSKRQAETVLADYAARSGAAVVIFRLSNVFGKWCRPNYNSVVATFCYNMARDLPIIISDPERKMSLVHVDDVARAFLAVADTSGLQAIGRQSPVSYREAQPIYTVTLRRLAELIRSFRESRQSLRVPDLSDPFTHKLHGTFLSYLAPHDFAYDLAQRTDPRGTLAEFVKSEPFGQIFVSRTKPGITRGNHFHHTKAEKFLVLEGEAVIRFCAVQGPGVEVQEYRVSGREFRVVDVPPGYTHSIENVGVGELVTLFWASEVFDPERPDTFWEHV